MQGVPLVSIITVSFNSEKYIAETIESVLKQEYTNIEYVIIDGGSNDNTLAIIKKYEPQFKGRMKWISEPDKGIYDAMNKGISKSSGSIIGLLNSDDYLTKDSIRKVVNIYNTNNDKEYFVISGLMSRVDLNGNTIYVKKHHSYQKFSQLIKQATPISHPALFVPKVVYEKYGYFDTSLKILADYEFILRIFYSGVDFILADEVITHFREGGISDKNIMRRTLESYKARKKYMSTSLNIKQTLKFLVTRVKGKISTMLPSSVIKSFYNYKYGGKNN